MSPELASAFLMMAGLAQAPSIRDCAQTFDTYGRAIAAAKTLRVTFTRTVINDITQKEKKSNGIFLMRREGGDAHWHVELTDPTNNQDEESWTWTRNSLWEKRCGVNQLCEHIFAPDQKNQFDCRWVAVILPMAVPSLHCPAHEAVPVKCEDMYLYVRMIPKRAMERSDMTFFEALRALLSYQLLPDASEVRIVLAQQSSRNFPKGMLRRYEWSQSHREKTRLDFFKWIINDADDLTNLKIDQPTVPVGWSKLTRNDTFQPPFKKP